MNRKEDPRKSLNMKLNENAQGEGLIPRREYQARTEMYCRRKGEHGRKLKREHKRQSYSRHFINR